MARGSDQANAASTAGVGQNAAMFGQNQQLYSTLAPQLQQQAANPQGFGAPAMAKMQTEAQESAGGGQAAAVGQGALEEARTRNAGGAGAALSKAARESGKNLLKAQLGTSIENEQLKEQQRARAQGELGQLYGTGVSGGNAALGQVASNVNANANQEDASWGWAKNILQPVLKAAGGVGAAAMA